MKRFAFFIIVCFFVAGCNSFERKEATAHSRKTAKDSLNKQNPIEVLNKKILTDPSNPQLYVRRGKIYLQNNQLEEAQSDALRALEADSTYSEAYELLADVSIALKNGSVVKDYLEKSISFNPENISAHLKLAQLYLAFENFEDAIKSVNKALKIDIHNADAYYLKSTIFLVAGDTAKAISNLQTAIEQKPEFYKAYVDLGYIYASQNNPLALEYYNNAIRINPTNPVAIYNKSVFLQKNGFVEKALEGYDLLIKINPKDYQAYYNTGYIYLTEIQDYGKAIKFFKKTLLYNPQYADAYYNLGLSYELNQKADSAVYYYQKALEINPQHILAAKGLRRLK